MDKSYMQSKKKIATTYTHPLLFPLSAEAKRGNVLIYNNISPLPWFTRKELVPRSFLCHPKL
jgi:hypothetical protein